ncbi:putative nucleic acid-binding protein [Arabidopsis thaliana]
MDSNGSTKLMLFEFDAKQIVSFSAYDLLNGEYDEIKDPTILPQPLVNFVGKTFQFVVSIEKDNINDGNDTYKVAYAWVGLEPLQSDTIHDSDLHDDLQTIVSVEQDTMSLSNSSERVDSLKTHSMTPSSKRKDEVDDLRESQSLSSKKLCIPSIGDHIVKETGNSVEDDFPPK